MGESANEHLPVDMRRAQGIGGGASENKKAAAAHAAALEGASGASREPAEAEVEEEGNEEKQAAPTNCPHCTAKLSDEWNFCAKCGRDLIQDPRKQLRIDFTSEDLDEYLFKGYLTKDIGIVGKSLVLRSSKAEDAKDISAYLMENWNGTQVTSEFWENLQGTAAISLGILSFNEQAIGETVQERVDWMLKLGSALHDLLTQRVVLFNRAVTEWLQEKDTFLAS